MKESGLTLVEVLVSLAIITVLTGVTFIGLMSTLPDFRLNAAVREIVSTLNLARSEAVTNNAKSVVIFDLNNHEYKVILDGDEIHSRQLENDIEFHNCTISGNQYNARGVLNATGVVFLTNSQNDFKGVRTFLTGTLEIVD